MAKLTLINASMTKIAELVSAQRMAAGGMYEVVFLEDHFVCRKRVEASDGQTRLVLLRSRDVNEGLLSEQWDMVRIMLDLLIKRGELK